MLVAFDRQLAWCGPYLLASMPPDAIPPADGSTTSCRAAEAKSVNVNNTTSAVTSLASLTDEVLLEILYCVSPLEILHRVCRVSKRLAAITTSRDADLRYWRYHPQLPRSLRERLRDEDADTRTSKKKAPESGRHHGDDGTSTESGPRPLNLDRRQLQMLVCLCTPGADGFVPKRLRQVDLLPSQEVARSTSVEIYGGLMLRRRCCLASSEDHEHEDVKRVLRHGRRTKNRDDEVLRRMRARAGGHIEEDSDENGAAGEGDTTDDAEEDEEEQIRQGRAVPKASENMEPNPSYDALWDYISREEPDLGPPQMNGHIDLAFFMRVMRQEGTYWSSQQSESCSTDENLLFATRGCEHSLISCVAIKPFRELRLDEGHVAYTWPKVLVSVYSIPVVEDEYDDEEDEDDGSKEGGRETSVWSNVMEPPPSALERQRGEASGCPSNSSMIPTILAGHHPVYTSAPRECDATNTGWQHFRLPPGVVGNVVVFTLRGKYNRQFEESGYYACVDRVECRGVPLWSSVA